MYVIEVIPLQRGTTAESLSYYAGESYSTGTVITVPVRNKMLQAVVIESKPVSKAKTALKAATFSLRKLAPQENVITLPESLIKTTKALSETYPTSLGALMYALLPPDIRTGARPYPQTTCQQGVEDTVPFIYTGTRADRFLLYKSHIRQAFAHRGSVLFVVPNSASVAYAKEMLKHGIEKRVITFSSTHTKKQIEKSYEAFGDLSVAKLIITTPSFAFLERHDITNIIIEESGNAHYKARTRPYLDARVALKTYARVSGKSILLCDLLPPTEDEILRKEEVYGTFEEHTKRLQFTSTFNVAEHAKKEKEQSFSLFTPTLTNMMELSLRNKGKVFLYAARKGMAPLITCYDCGYVFRCEDSNAPYSLLKSFEDGEEKRWFMCTTSGKKIPAADVCPECSSWRLREQGIGIQTVETYTRELFPKTKILRLDHQTATTYNKTKKIIDDFYASKSVILIGTAMALPYIQKPVDVTAVTSYEALRAMPTWRAEETVLSFLLQLREKTLKDCIVQTRSAPDTLLKIASKGLIDQFYDEEAEVRKALGYPPFSYFVLLTYIGTKEQTTDFEENLIVQLPGYILQSYGIPQSNKPSQTRHTLIRIPRDRWPDEHLTETLRALPPSVKIEVNPDKIV